VRIAPQNYAYELEYQINKYIAVKSSVNVWYIIFVKCEEKILIRFKFRYLNEITLSYENI